MSTELVLGADPSRPIAVDSESPGIALPTRKCHAHSARTGLPCNRFARPGMSVCATHGGSSPQVIAAARRRILEMVDPALARLHDAVEQPQPFDKLHPAAQAVVIGAAKDILDRAGLGATSKVDVTRHAGEAEVDPETGQLRALDLSRLTDWQLALMTSLRRVALGIDPPGETLNVEGHGALTMTDIVPTQVQA